MDRDTQSRKSCDNSGQVGRDQRINISSDRFSFVVTSLALHSTGQYPAPCKTGQQNLTDSSQGRGTRSLHSAYSCLKKIRCRYLVLRSTEQKRSHSTAAIACRRTVRHRTFSSPAMARSSAYRDMRDSAGRSSSGTLLKTSN